MLRHLRYWMQGERAMQTKHNILVILAAMFTVTQAQALDEIEYTAPRIVWGTPGAPAQQSGVWQDTVTTFEPNGDFQVTTRMGVGSMWTEIPLFDANNGAK